MKFIRALKKEMLVISCIYIAIGIIILVNKDNSYELVMKILSYGLGIAGIISMIKYFTVNVKDRIQRSDFIEGSLLLAITALLLIDRIGMLNLVGKILGIAMVVSGLHKIQDLFDTKACGKGATSLYLFGFTVCAGLGVFVLCNDSISNAIFFIVIGLGMCVCGISDLVSNFYVASCVAYLDEPAKEKEEVKENTKEEKVEETKEEIKEEEKEDEPLV